jgi:hypothetical protein
MDLSKQLFVPVLEDNDNQGNTITQLNDYNILDSNDLQNDALEVSNIEAPKMDEPENFEANMNEFKVMKKISDKEVEILPSISGRSLLPNPLPPANDASLSEDERYAIQFFEMLNMKEEFEKMDKDTEFENYLSKILFQCILSVLVGYIYNYFINEFTIYNQYFNEDQAHKFAFEVLANQICTDDMINDLPSNIGDVSGYPTCIYPDDYAEKAKFINQVKGFLLKPNTLKPAFKQFIDAKPDVLADNYETMFEMVMRFGVKTVPDNASFRLRILINVCSKIKALLESCEFIKNGYIQPLIQPLMDIAVPIVGAAQDVSGLTNASMLGRIKSLIVLAAAYNSYGWLFAIIAPFAVPAAVNVVTGSVKGLCKIALLPIKVIQYVGTGIGQKTRVTQQRTNNPINRLIIIGHTIKVLPGDQGIIKIPYYVNLNDILDLSEELQNWQFLKRSLLCSVFDGHGVFDLADIQGPSTGDRFLAPNNPIVTLTNYINDELLQLSKFANDNVIEDEDGYLPVFPELPLRILINSMKGVSNKSSQILRHPVVIQTIKMWWESIKNVNFTVNGAILKLLTCSADFGDNDGNISEEEIERGSIISDISSDSFHSAIEEPLFIFEEVPNTPNTISMVVAEDDMFSENGSCSFKSFPDNSVCSILSNGNNNAISILDEISNNAIGSTKHYFNYPDINSNLELPENNQIESLTITLPDSSVLKMSDLLTVKNLTESLKYSQPSTEYLGLKKLWEVKKIGEPSATPLKLEEFIVTTCPIIKGGRKRRRGNLSPRKAARKQNKLVNQHRTVNNPSIMQYMPEHYVNYTKNIKSIKSKRKINKKHKTKRKANPKSKSKQHKIATKKVFRKHHLTKKRQRQHQISRK